MNFFFWIIVLLIVILIWCVFSFSFKPIGKIFMKSKNNIKNNIYDEKKKEEK